MSSRYSYSLQPTVKICRHKNPAISRLRYLGGECNYFTQRPSNGLQGRAFTFLHPNQVICRTSLNLSMNRRRGVSRLGTTETRSPSRLMNSSSPGRVGRLFVSSHLLTFFIRTMKAVIPIFRQISSYYLSIASSSMAPGVVTSRHR